MHCPSVPIVHLDPLDTPASTCRHALPLTMCIQACDRGTRASQHNICTRGLAHSCTAAPAVPEPCQCMARFEFIAAVAKPSRRGAPSSTAAAPKGSMFSFIICSCHRPRRGAPCCSWSSAVASVQVLDALQRSTFAGTPAADAGHPCGHQKRANF